MNPSQTKSDNSAWRELSIGNHLLTVWRVSCEDNTLGTHQLVCGALRVMVSERERSIEQGKENHSSGEKERSLDSYYDETAANVHEFDFKMY